MVGHQKKKKKRFASKSTINLFRLSILLLSSINLIINIQVMKGIP